MSNRQPKSSYWQDAPLPREKLVLFDETLEQRIPEDHPVRILDEILSVLNWNEWEADYNGPPPGFGEVAPDGFAMKEAPLALAHHCGHDRWRIIYAAGAKAKGECTCGVEIPLGYMFILRTAPLRA